MKKTNNKKITTITTIFIILLMFFIPLNLNIKNSNAVTVTILDTNQLGDGFSIKTLFPSATSDNSVAGETVEASIAGYLTQIHVMLKKTNTPTGTLRISIYSITGTYGSTAVPSILLTQSVNTISCSDVPPTTATEFQFNFDNQTHFSVGDRFAIVLYQESGICNSTFYVSLNGKSTGTYSGNPLQYKNGDWDVSGTADSDFEVFGSDIYLAPSPTPTPLLSFTQDWTTPQPINYSSFYWNITGKTYPIVGLYQETNYTMLNHVWNNTVPYVNGNYAIYYSLISNGSLGANIYNVLWDSYNGTMNLNKTGTVGNGYFYHYVKPELYEGRYTYQLMRINGTITGTTETFSQDIIIQAFVPSMTTTLYLTGGRYINPFTMLKLSYNYLSQATYYNIKGYVTINSILGNGTGNYTLSTSYLSANPINYAEFIGIGQTTNFSIFQVTQGNVLNGQFQFTLAPRTFSQTKVYQVLVVNVTLDSGFNTIDYYSLEFDSYLSTPNTSSIDNNFAEGAGTFWLILMLVLFVPVMGVTIYVAMLTRSGSATALVFFGGTLLDIIFGVSTGLLDWWVIVIIGIFLVISAYAQWGKVTSGG